MSLIQRIDALLPQTQCGKCGHPGCKPYAEGIAQGEAINKCPPGGRETITGLARLLNVQVLELDTSRGVAPPQVALIREAECIGCTKCIQACPVDAIVGAAKFMHSVISDECTGCDLCVAPCPVDCIDMVPLPLNVLPIVGGLASDDQQRLARTRKREHARRRFEQRNARLLREKQLREKQLHEEQQKQAERLARAKRSAHQVDAPAANPVQAAMERLAAQKTDDRDAALKKAKITLAMSRAQLNKSLKAFGHPPTFEQQSQLILLQQQFEVAEQALAVLETEAPPVEAVLPAKDADLKRAKIQLAMRRAELKKAQNNEASAEQLSALSAALTDAETTLHAVEEVSEQPRPDLQRVEKRPIANALRLLKTELAYARADVSKMERQPDVDPQALAKARQLLSEAQRRVDSYVGA